MTLPMTLRRLVGLVALTLSCITSAAARAETNGQELAVGAGQSLIGTQAPRLVLKTIDGETIDLGSSYGKRAVYLKFWATWCVPCRQQMPHFEHVYETAGPDLTVIAIDVGFNDTVDAIRTYRKRLGITMPIVFDEDGKIGAALHLRVTPQHIVIGRDGRIEYVGHLADTSLDAALLAARSARGVTSPSSALESGNVPASVRYGIGDTLPAQTVRTLDGQTFRLPTPPPSHPTVLVFLTPWCETYLATTRPGVSAACRAARIQVAALARGERFRWLGVASGLWATANDLQEYRANFKVNIPLMLDDTGALYQQFAVNNTPTLIVIDNAGKVVRRVEASDVRALRQALDGL
jgi:thiol-disulfide isomerase/thioredoxin